MSRTADQMCTGMRLLSIEDWRSEDCNKHNATELYLFYMRIRTSFRHNIRKVVSDQYPNVYSTHCGFVFVTLHPMLLLVDVYACVVLWSRSDFTTSQSNRLFCRLHHFQNRWPRQFERYLLQLMIVTANTTNIPRRPSRFENAPALNDHDVQTGGGGGGCFRCREFLLFKKPCKF